MMKSKRKCFGTVRLKKASIGENRKDGKINMTVTQS